ncbi:MAG TPA: glycosyl transferase [Chitinophagaceae bacterium]|nr:glycosyl transferase [Chitinophagaceae bacterium]
MSLVSVIIPNYNHGRFLSERIDSILNQSFTEFECIVLDDASNDNSKAIIEGYVTKDTRIKFYPFENNSGSPFVQWNRGVELASNDLIWIAESDDSCDTTLLQTLVNEHLKYPHIGLAYCQSLKIDADSNISGSWKDFTFNMDAELFNVNFIMDGMDFISNFLIHKNVIPNASAVVFKKSVFGKAGGADVFLTTNSDWLCWLTMLVNHSVAFVPHPLNKFRFHSDSVIAKHKSFCSPIYKEQFDCSMRYRFELWCKEQRVHLSAKILAVNQQYISYDIGNRGLHLFRNGKWLNGLADIIKASVFPQFTLGYVRRIFRRGNS